MKHITYLIIFFLFISFVSADPLATDESTVGTPPSCGDGTCNGDEVCDVCIADCGVCINSPLNGTNTSTDVSINIQCSSDSDCPSGEECSSGTCTTISTPSSSSGGGSSRRYQCYDRIDNDEDGLCDYNGCFINGVKLEKDPDCYGYYDNDESNNISSIVVALPEPEPTPPPVVKEAEPIPEPEEHVIELDLPPKEEWEPIEEPEPEPEPTESFWSKYKYYILLFLGLVLLLLLFLPLFVKKKPKEQVVIIEPEQVFVAPPESELHQQMPIIEPSVIKPPLQTYPEIEEFKRKIKDIDGSMEDITQSSIDQYNEVASLKSTLHSTASELSSTYSELDKSKSHLK